MLFFSDGQLNAQNVTRKSQLGQQYFSEEYYVLALKEFNEILKGDSTTTDDLFYASLCYLNLQKPSQAKCLLGKIESPNYLEKYYLALSNLQLENFEVALSILNSLPDSLTDSGMNISKLKGQIQFAIQNYQNDKGFIVINFGDSINTPDREYSSVMINKFDSVLFTSRKLFSNTTFTSDGMGFENMYLTTIDKNDTWVKPVKFQNSLQSNHGHDATVQIFNSEDRMIFFHDGDLFYSKKENGRWAKESELKEINTLDTETHCFITEDEKTIYFSSDFMSERGDLDLFISQKQTDGKWGKPQPIIELNTQYDEDAPFLAQDGTFYFSSKGHNSMGGFDVFATMYRERTNDWAPIQNLGYPINSVCDDIYFNTYGKLAYLSSARAGGYGSLDLYRVFLFNKIKMKGRIINQSDQQPVAGATIDFEYGPWFLRGYSDIDGNYEMSVPVNKNMRVTVERDSIKIHQGNYIVKVFFNEHNNNHYDFAVNLDLSSDDIPTLTADIFNLADTVSINLLVKNDLEKNSLLARVPGSEEGNWVDSLNNLYYQNMLMESYYKNRIISTDNSMTILFGFDQYSLTAESRRKLEQFAGKLRNKDNWTIDISGHTDAAGDNLYNMRLSLKRSQSVYKYLTGQNLNPDNMLVKGFGETNLLLTDQSQNAQKFNRRVEIKILENEK